MNSEIIWLFPGCPDTLYCNMTSAECEEGPKLPLVDPWECGYPTADTICWSTSVTNKVWSGSGAINPESHAVGFLFSLDLEDGEAWEKLPPVYYYYYGAGLG